MAIKKTNTFRAFRNRNYTLYFAGQGFSQIGTWMQRTSVSWVVYTITHSTLMLGLTVFASQFPSFLFSLLGGIASDRYNRYKILFITQSAAMVQAVLLAILIFTNHYAVWEILALSVILGIINAFDTPARQPLVHEMVGDKADLPNALALTSSMNNLARLIGPALSGIVLVKFGAGICFLLNAASFVTMIIALALMKVPPYKPSPLKTKVKAELVEGFTYLKSTPPIRMMILVLILVSFLVLPYNTLFPVFAKVVFKGDAATFGYISSFVGLGALAGTFYLASLKPGTDLKVIMLINTIILGICLVFFSYIVSFPLAMVFATVTGFATVCLTTICITTIQVESGPHMRGRMISYVAMAYFGMLPVGSLLIGVISKHVGAPATILWQGILAVIIAAIFFKFLSKDKPNKTTTGQLEEVEELVTE
jgi:MFS family permease